jgi:hypothetical protein
MIGNVFNGGVLFKDVTSTIDNLFGNPVSPL